MPKQLYKITQFHGGLNNNADPRDIVDNELSESVDIDVSNLGKITMLGGFTAHSPIGANAVTGFTGTMIEGRGLISFRSDYIGGEDGGTATRYDDLMIAVYDDADQQVWVYSYFADAIGGTGWDDDAANAENGVIDIGTGGSAKPTMYYVDGSLRVADGSFNTNNTPKWYGVIARTFFGDGSTGLDHATYSNGVAIATWKSADAAINALSLKEVTSGTVSNVTSTATDATDMLAVFLEPHEVDYQDLTSGATIQAGKTTLKTEVDFHADGTITADTDSTGCSITPGYTNFCSVGEYIGIASAADSENNEQIYLVTDITDNATSPNVLTVVPSVTNITTRTGDDVYMYNLSRMGWFDSDLPAWQIAVSTLYDDSKQESPLSTVGTTLDPWDICSEEEGMNTLKFNFLAWAGNYNTESTGIPFTQPRVSGFNVYMRRTDGTSFGDWYLQAEVDISKGIKLFASDDYNMWEAIDHPVATHSAYAISAIVSQPSFLVTYEANSGISASQSTMGFSGAGTGYLTATIANRICYVGNVAIYNSEGTLVRNSSAILKSFVNKFDSFSYDRRIETSISDGSEIRALEVYADRLLSFKTNKMELINISQELEFLEDTFMHKGAYSQAHVCKTDFGIAWANDHGCYLYDGQKVNNLLEKGGRRLIDDSTWSSFWTDGMVGYIPQKRQIVVVDAKGTGGDGSVYLFDLVTQSWTRGAAATAADQLKTNFTTDPWGSLIYFNGSDNKPYKWDPDPDSSSAVDIQTKDIDFGQPGQLKNIYKVYLTYRGVGTHVQLHYGVDGLAPALTFNSITSGTDGSSTGSGTAAKSIPYDAGVTDWLKAELKPSASIRNVNSFRLKLSGDGSNAIATDFEINDITVVYRLKGQR